MKRKRPVIRRGCAVVTANAAAVSSAAPLLGFGPAVTLVPKRDKARVTIRYRWHIDPEPCRRATSGKSQGRSDVLSLDRTWPETELGPAPQRRAARTFPTEPFRCTRTLASTRARHRRAVGPRERTRRTRSALPCLEARAFRGPRVSPYRVFRALTGAARFAALNSGSRVLQAFGERDDLGFLIVGPLRDFNIKKRVKLRASLAHFVFDYLLCSHVQPFL